MPNLNINGRNMSVEASNDTPLLLGHPRAVADDRYEVRLRRRPVRRLHGSRQRRSGALLPDRRSATPPARRSPPSKVCTAKGDHPLQKAWIAEQVPQCGYCQSGQIMQAASLLAKNTNPTKEEVVAHMDGNLCRCMTYSRIQKAIMRAASEMRTASNAGTERRAT